MFVTQIPPASQSGATTMNARSLFCFFSVALLSVAHVIGTSRMARSHAIGGARLSQSANPQEPQFIVQQPASQTEKLINSFNN
jgi:hypothetical protein